MYVGVSRREKKFPTFASISMEVTTQMTNVDQIDFFKQDSEVEVPAKPNDVVVATTIPKENIDLSLKLSLDNPNGPNAEEMPLTRSSTIAGELTSMADSSVPSLDRSSSLPVERNLVRFGDLQAMRRLETGKRWLQEKLRRAAAVAAAAAEAAKRAPVAADKLKMVVANPAGDDSSENEGNFIFIFTIYI